MIAADGRGWTAHSPRLLLVCLLASLLICITLSGCSTPGRSPSANSRVLAAEERPSQPAGNAPAAPALPGRVHATGKLRAVEQQMILAPRLQGRVFQFTLTGLIPNGTRVKQGDIVAEFDRTAQVEEARTATAQVADLGHQIERRRAENHANAAKRSAEMREAQAAWEKARIQLRIAEVRSEIERDKNRVLSDAASKRVEMLREIHRLRDEADAAELRILELQRDRQQVALDRATRNAELLVMTSPMAGMVSIESVWKSGTQGPAQVGDRLYRGSPLMRIFNPARMEVTVELGEPDGAILKKGARAEVLLDAYPDLVFHGTLVTASPVASSALGSPIRRFTATFAIEESDPHLLPDLSAQVVIRPQPATGGAHE